MFRVMDSYRKSVDYFNSYGIKSRPFTATSKNGEAGTGKNSKGTGTFWDLRVWLRAIWILNYVTLVNPSNIIPSNIIHL